MVHRLELTILVSNKPLERVGQLISRLSVVVIVSVAAVTNTKVVMAATIIVIAGVMMAIVVVVVVASTVFAVFEMTILVVVIPVWVFDLPH
jgi:hypothetical protein